MFCLGGGKGKQKLLWSDVSANFKSLEMGDRAKRAKKKLYLSLSYLTKNLKIYMYI